MPIDYEIREDRGLVVTRFHGAVTDGDLAAHVARLASDSAASRCHELVLFDRTAVSSATPLAIRSAAQHMRKHAEPGNKKLAIVAISNVAFGLAKVFSVHRDDENKNTNVDVFRSLSQALQWLELPPDVLD